MDSILNLNPKAQYTPDLAFYELQSKLQFLRESLTFLRRLLFRNASKLAGLDKNRLLTNMQPTKFEIEELGFKEGETLCVYLSYYSKEALEECLDTGLGYLESSYRDFLGKAEAIERSSASDREKIDGFEDLEFEADKANADLMVFADAICRAFGDNYNELWRAWQN